MKKRIYFRILSLLLVFFISPQVLATQSPTIHVAGDENFPPIEYLHNDHPEGKFHDFLTELEKVIPYRIIHKLYPWKESQKMVLEGMADALSIFVHSPERAKHYDFTESFFPMEFCFFVLSSNRKILGIDTLEGQRVGVTDGGYARQVLTKNPSLHLVSISNNLDGFKMLQAGNLDAVATDKWVGSYTLKINQIKGVKTITPGFAIRFAPMAVKKGNIEHLQALNKGIQILKASGKLNQLKQFWNPGEIIQIPKQRLTRITLWVSLIILVILLFLASLWVSSLRKINQRLKQEKEKGEQREQQYYDLFENAPSPYLAVSPLTKKIVRCNKAMTTFVGWSKEELIGMEIFNLYADTPDGKPKAQEVFKRFIKQEPVNNEEIQLNHKKGHFVWGSLSVSPLMNSHGDIIESRSIYIDITEQKEIQIERDSMQAQLNQSAKLASIGVLASGVAHELNNPLAIVAGQATLINNVANDPYKIEQKVNKIKVATERMRKIIDHLRSFSRESKEDDWKSINISTPIVNALEFLEVQLGLRGIRIKQTLTHKDGYVWGDTTQLESVFQNLLVNSRDAFEDTGDVENKVITITTEVINNEVKFIYTDNAGGIPEKILDRVFDPFFTTKEAGRGTGLGLSISRNIIEKHRGSFYLESTEGEGSKFTIILPRDKKEEQDNSEVKQNLPTKKPAHDTKQKPRVLIIDDEEDLRGLLEELLEDYFQIQAMGNESDAFSIIEQGNIDLILTDLMMPDISGLDILFHTQKHSPQIPVIIMTGCDPDDKELQNALEHGAKGYISKPFSNVKSLTDQLYDYLS